MNKNNSRFMCKVKKTRSCWEWTACKDINGYGKYRIDNKLKYAHRVSYNLYKGKIKKGHCIMHKCDNPSCVNPDHLLVGTQKDNILDMHKKLRGKNVLADRNKKKTHCINGHKFNKENTYINKKGHRQCRRCDQNRTRRL